MRRKAQPAILRKLEAIRRRDHGELKAESVVQEALAHPDGPLKEGLPAYFWDDNRCAAEHRIYLVRKLISVITVETVTEERTIIAPYYVHTGGKDQGYSCLVEVKTEREKAISLLREEFARVNSILERAMNIAEVLDLQDETERLLDQVRHIQERLNTELTS